VVGVRGKRSVGPQRGLRHSDLILAVQAAYEHAIDTGDKSDYRKAHQALLDFRDANADYDKTDFAGLTGKETAWDRKMK